MDQSQFKQFSDEFSIPINELKIQEMWEEKEIYKKQNELRKGDKLFNFCDGPPFVSGDLHMGHMLVSFIKSSVCNFMAMTGHDVKNKLGFDTHGLPIEQLVNKELGLGTRQDVINLGVNHYNEYCKKTIHKLSGSWEPVFKRIGRFIDYENQYKTMDRDFMETCWWVFKELWKKKLVYRGYKVMHFSTGLNTPISNHEASQNYKEVDDQSVFVHFKVLEYDNEVIKSKDNLYLVAWTTTPWTLPTNMALAINSKLEYMIVIDHKTNNEYIIGKDAVNNLYTVPKKKSDYVQPYTVLKSGIQGKDLIGLKYEPLFNYFPELEYRVIGADYVTAESGTGIVHLAPAYGEEDFNTCIENGIVTTKTVGDYCPIDEEGKFTDKIPEYQGIYFKDADPLIIKYLKESGKLVKQMQYRHNYPYCWRTDTPLIYMANPSFFIDVPTLREQMVENNKNISWTPMHIGDGRFHQWLIGAREWSVSRKRFFGTPLPIFMSDDGEEMVCIGSIDELVERAGLTERPSDIHPEFISKITIKSSQGKGDLTFCGDVFDCWFESGCVPYAQNHFPFDKNADMFSETKDAPIHFIAEGVDQTRGWFYTLNVLSTALFGKPAFTNAICTGLILAEDGRKISKRLGNYVPPEEVFDKCGCDALRLYLISSTAAHADAFKFVLEDVDDTSKRLYQLYNVYRFFVEQAIKFNKDGHVFTITDYNKSTNVMDQWIIARLGTLVQSIHDAMKQFKVYKVYPEVQRFIEDMANWYTKFNRNRMKGINVTTDEQSVCLSTCWYVLYTLSKVLTPFAPFISETFYQQLQVAMPQELQTESVHLCDYPKMDEFTRDPDIERKMQRLQTLSAQVRNMRYNTKTHTSQKTPIESLQILVNDTLFVQDIRDIESYLLEEINCFNVSYGSTGGLITYNLIPDQKSIGLTFRKDAKKIKDLIANLDKDTVESYALNKITEITTTFNGVQLSLNPYIKITTNVSYEPVETEQVQMEDGVMVIVDFNYSDKVKRTFMKTLFVREVQEMRKNTGLHPWNKIGIYYRTDNQELLSVLTEFKQNMMDSLFYDIWPIDMKPVMEKTIIENDCLIGDCKVHVIITDVAGDFL
jgi:isoleucyl-tRNA synthetase